MRLITLLTILWLAVLATACSSEPATPTITPTPAVPTPIGTEEAAGTPAEESAQLSQLQALDEMATIAAQRTPIPTRAPGPVKELAQEIAEESGLDDMSFLGLTLTSWIDLAISILIILFVVYIGLKLLFALLKAVVRRTKTSFDDEFLEYIERELKWLIAIIVTAQAAVLRLDFLSEGSRLFLEDIFFLLTLAFIYIIVLRLIHFASVWYRRKRLSPDQRKQMDPIIEMGKRLGYLLASMLALNSVLGHFGVEITMLTVVFLFAAAVLFLGARAAFSDAVSGFFILVSQPFRVNDTIYIKELDTRGNVEEIGIRTTRIGTRDGREVIVPNALIATSQVINYTYPDPNFRVELEFLTYGSDIEHIQEVIEEAVRGVAGVLPDRPVDILYIAFGGTSRQLRVRWWVDDVNKHNRIRNLVNIALDRALDEAGIDTPNLTYDLNLNAMRETISDATQALSDGSSNEPA
jgi:small-conductance mechanosensitive channel